VHASLEIQDFGNFPAWDRGTTPPKDGDTWIIALGNAVRQEKINACVSEMAPARYGLPRIAQRGGEDG
jgi:hypothetical protein